MYKQIKKFEDDLNSLDLTGRDSFYTHLLEQEIPFWMDELVNDKLIADDEVEMLINRRGFNDEEASKFKKLADFLNNNIENIKNSKLYQYNEENKKELAELRKIAVTETDDSVSWNPYNCVIQSHRDGSMFISIDNALKFAKDYHKEQLIECVKNSNCRCNEPMSEKIEECLKQTEDSFNSEKPFGNVEPIRSVDYINNNLNNLPDIKDYFKDC